MNRSTLVWDLPTRLFHVVFGASFLGAYAIAVATEDRAAIFVVHMLLGAVAAFAVTLRALWGLIGSRYARFASFVPGLSSVVAYLKDLRSARGASHVGHNPASSVVILGMFVAMLGVAGTGALIGTFGHSIKEVHELLSHALFALAAIHLAGVLAHALRKRDGLVLSMVDGKKDAAPAEGIRSAHPGVALAFVAMTAAFAVGLVQGYDSATRTVSIPVVGQQIKVGRPPRGDRGPRQPESSAQRADADGDDDDDDDD